MDNKLYDFLFAENDHLLEAIAPLIFDGGKSSLPENISVEPYQFFDGLSGYEYFKDQVQLGSFNFGVSQIGTFVIKKEIIVEDKPITCVDNFSADGRFLFREDSMSAYILYVDYLEFDNEHPLINHLYNTLSYQYRQTSKGDALTKVMDLSEKILRELYKSEDVVLNVEKREQDPAIIRFNDKYKEIEFDRVLTWKEKRISKNKAKEDEETILKTLKRVHHLTFWKYFFYLKLSRFIMGAKFIIQNPVQNFRGYLNRYTFGVMGWFLSVVKNNIGYSIALAVYAPFTYYFITQPMNPHAMWAVGKVRNAYLNVVSEVNIKDTIQTKLSALQKLEQDQTSYTNNPNWEDRMSAFKAMQIGLEKNMIVAERMGRVEQLESNFNFTLIAEQAFHEIERYEREVELTLKFNKELRPYYKKYLEEDLQLAKKNKIYVWKKLYQFFADHPYILMDVSEEHKEKSYYLGRSFIAFEKMTEKLLKEKVNLPETEDTIRLKKLAQSFLDMKQEMGSVISNVTSNSKFYQPNQEISSEKLRSHMKRQWETIFLQQNKRQEAATFGLQAYVWSVRQAVWVLQSYYSNKKDELPTLNYRYNENTQNPSKVLLDDSYNETYESLFHILAYEFASIKRELKENLPGDQEASLRETLVSDIKANLLRRDNLLRKGKEIARAPEGRSEGNR